MTWLKETAWPWLRKWGTLLLGVVALVFGAGWLWNTYKGKLGRVKDKLAVAEAMSTIRELRGARESIKERVDEKGEALAVIDRRLAENKRRVVESYEGGKDLTDEQVLEEFAYLGI